MVATRKLVDGVAEQELLEELIESVKPPLPGAAGLERLHYLLSTPFRYPPLRHGSRFGTRTEPALWYGAEERRTAFAEVAYYRLLFLAGTAAALEPVAVPLTIFEVPIRTRRGVDLTRPPFAAERVRISSPSSYAASQQLGRVMRASGVEAFRYWSARAPGGGVGVGVLSPTAFAARRPTRVQTWYCVAAHEGVDFSRMNFPNEERFGFPRTAFEVDGMLPLPAL